MEPDANNEERLIKLYRDLTGSDEGEARCTFMFLESTPALDGAAVQPSPPATTVKARPGAVPSPLPATATATDQGHWGAMPIAAAGQGG